MSAIFYTIFFELRLYRCNHYWIVMSFQYLTMYLLTFHVCIADLQNATECLAAFVREGSEALLEWGGDADQTMRMLLDTIARYTLQKFCHFFHKYSLVFN